MYYYKFLLMVALMVVALRQHLLYLLCRGYLSLFLRLASLATCRQCKKKFDLFLFSSYILRCAWNSLSSTDCSFAFHHLLQWKLLVWLLTWSILLTTVETSLLRQISLSEKMFLKFLESVIISVFVVYRFVWLWHIVSKLKLSENKSLLSCVPCLNAMCSVSLPFFIIDVYS